MLKYKADLFSLLYMVISTSLLIIQWSLPEFNPFLFAASLLMACTSFVIAHNHNHLPMWKWDFLNKITDYWLTIFYGFPPYVWVPTHNLNHHKYTNRDGDYTITYRISEKNNLFTMLSFPIVSAVFQQKPTSDYLKYQWKNNKGLFFYCISQYAFLIVFLAGAFYLDWKKALLYIVIPQQFSVQFVLIINYIQHVHCDEESKYNHSRNFLGWGNKFLLNNGLHTAHHENMGMHWSELPKAHAAIAHKIDPSLNEPSLPWYLFRVYILGVFIPKFRTKSMRLERLQKSEAM